MAIKNSVTDLMPKQYNHIYRYDMMAVVMAEDYDDFTKQIDTDSNISDYLGLQMDTVQAKNESQTVEETVPLYVIPKDASIADYINLEECLDLSLPIAKKLQSAFTSWEELADSYIYGYAFWQNETADDVETKFRIQAYAELVEMENSPYSVAYDTKLENTWKDGEKRKEERKAYEMSDGYVPIRCTDTESVQVRLPEEYVFDKEDYEEYENTKFTKPCGDGDSIYISYQAEFLDDRNNAELQKKYWTEGNAQEKENAEKKGGTYEAGEIKSLSVKEDLTVFYLAEKEVTEGGTQQISYQAVAEVGGKYLVKCYISDVASPGYELMLGMNEEALIKELFSDFRW